MTKTIALLGATGSIGRQTLEVAGELGLRVAALTANTQVDLLEQQARQYMPRLAVLYDENAALALKKRLRGTGIEVMAGEEGLLAAAAMTEADTVVTAVMGSVGLRPTLAAIQKGKRIALANAHDEPALSAVVNARRKGVVEGTLVGKKNEIIAMLHEMGESEKDYEIVDFDGEELDAAKLTVQLVREGKADIPMKGILQTSNFARAILNRETGLIPASGKRLVSQCGIFEYEGRFVMITDAAINIAPDVDTQIGIVENALPVANALGIECPKVAVLSAVENVTEKMPSTVSAKEIAERGVPGCIISGPLALDGAISMESVKHKAIHDPVAGQADILLVPYIEIGNVLYKACTYIAGKTMASTICGASCPVVITSRADTPDSKYYSILLAVLRCLKA